MKNFRFYAEMESGRGSKAGSKQWAPFTRRWLEGQAECGQHCNVIAVLLDDKGRPLWCGKDGDQMDAICPVSYRSNAPVELGLPSRDYLRKRCVRIPEDLARKLHPALFTYLETNGK